MSQSKAIASQCQGWKHPSRWNGRYLMTRKSTVALSRVSRLKLPPNRAVRTGIVATFESTNWAIYKRVRLQWSSKRNYHFSSRERYVIHEDQVATRTLLQSCCVFFVSFWCPEIKQLFLRVANDATIRTRLHITVSLCAHFSSLTRPKRRKGVETTLIQGGVSLKTNRHWPRFFRCFWMFFDPSDRTDLGNYAILLRSHRQHQKSLI